MKAFRMGTDVACERIIVIVSGKYGILSGPRGDTVKYIPSKVLYNSKPQKYTDDDVLHVLTGYASLAHMLDKKNVVAQMFEVNSKYVMNFEVFL